MFNKIKVFGLIPARKKSTGIKNKNIYKIGNKVLIDFTLEAAIKSKNIDQIFVSSDSNEILEHASKFPNITKIRRPIKYAKNNSTAVDVVEHFLDWINRKGDLDIKNDFYIVYLQPTSPLRNSKHLDNSFELMRNKDTNSLISVVKNNFSPFKSFKLDRNGLILSLFEQSLSNVNRQLLPDTYRANGAIYIFKASEFKKINGFPSNNSVPFIMKEADSIDVDTPREIEQLEQELERRSKI